MPDYAMVIAVTAATAEDAWADVASHLTRDGARGRRAEFIGDPWEVGLAGVERSTAALLDQQPAISRAGPWAISLPRGECELLAEIVTLALTAAQLPEITPLDGWVRADLEALRDRLAAAGTRT